MTDALYLKTLVAKLTRMMFAFRRFDLRYWLRSRLIPSCRYHVIDTGLSPGWHDVDERMLYGCMALLSSYIEREHDGAESLQEFVDELSADKEHDHRGQVTNDTGALAIYRWWAVERPAALKREDDTLMDWYDGGRAEEAFQLHTETARKNEARDQEMLHRLIDIRRSLWT